MYVGLDLQLPGRYSDYDTLGLSLQGWQNYSAYFPQSSKFPSYTQQGFEHPTTSWDDLAVQFEKRTAVPQRGSGSV